MGIENGWVLTDDSCAQHRKLMYGRTFRFIQIEAKSKETDAVRVREGELDLTKISDKDMASALSRYHKEPLEEFRRKYGAAADALLAEYLFEEHVDETLGEKEFPSEDAAREFLFHYI